MEHLFTKNIKAILEKNFGENAEKVFEKSNLVRYINEKTRSANKGSKARSSFGTLYAMYVIIQDYVIKEFDKSGNYSKYEGAIFSELLSKAKTLPFGNKIQNHYFNNRTNSEYKKYFPLSEYQPIIHSKKRYWINDKILKLKVDKTDINIARAVLEIIDDYAKTKQDAFQRFIKTCVDLQKIKKNSSNEVKEFIISLLAVNVDARLFEIVSYSILKYYFQNQKIYWSFEYTLDSMKVENLILYKTGRTNANDGGIDFVMKPLGRFFQVTETLDFKKYFLDIDKIQKYPLTFVIKSDDEIENIKTKIKENAIKIYSVNVIVENYMNCIEEVINIPILIKRFNIAIKSGYLNDILNEIITQSKVEFNYEDEIEEE